LTFDIWHLSFGHFLKTGSLDWELSALLCGGQVGNLNGTFLT